MASTYLTRTPSSSGNRRTFTISVWFKRTGLDEFNYIFDCDGGNSQSENKLGFYQDRLSFGVWNNSTSSSAINIETNRQLRDTNAWYHVVCAVDTTQSTASDRVKLYVNGELQTSLNQSTYPSQNYETAINYVNNPHSIGRWENGSSRYFNGLISHFHFCDGSAYAPTEFGETDSTTGEWKIKTSPSVTYGTNGFFILKDGNSLTDQSGNSNNWTVASGTLTKTEDCPSNVFATLNPLVYHNTSYGLPHYQHGNTRLSWQNGESHFMKAWSTLGANKGKYYFECKNYSTTNFSTIGIGDATGASSSNGYIGQGSDGAYTYGYYSDNGNYFNNGSSTAYGNAWDSSGAVAGCAVDLDNNKLYFSVNGVWQNSGDPTSGSTGTGAISIADPSTVNGGFYMFGVSRPNVGSNGYIDVNFGNGYWGSTQISSAGTNASGIGIFEYDVPTGFTALSTKGLNL
jgi:hypothetical protein